jgi:hypothetical protein
MEYGACIIKAGANVIASNARIIIQYLLFSPAICQQIDDEFNRQASTLDDGLAHKDFGINLYALANSLAVTSGMIL